VDQIGKLLPTLFKKEILRPEPRLLEILAPLWPRLVGKAMAEHSHPATFEFGALTLHTGCTTWGTQLRHMTEEIRLKVNGMLGREMVKKVRIKIVTMPQNVLKLGKVISSPTPELTASDLKSIHESIADPEIASALASSYARYFHRPRS
jgi:predicted nucleic acid-binding Zn ribbon protein